MVRIWTNRAIKNLRESTGISDPPEAIRTLALRLVERSGISSPPFSPFAMGSLLGVQKVSYRKIGFDAGLIPAEGGFEVLISSYHQPARQRFSMAHEVGHLGLSPWVRQAVKTLPAVRCFSIVLPLLPASS